MTSTAISAQGTSITIEGIEVENMITFSGLEGEASDLDATNMSSAAKENRAGMDDPSGFALEIHPDYSDSALGQNELREAQGDGYPRSFIVTLPDNTVLTFSAYVKNATSVNGGVDTALGGSVALVISGGVFVSGLNKDFTVDPTLPPFGA